MLRLALFHQIDEYALHHSIGIRYLTPVLPSRRSDPLPPIQMYDLLTPVAVKPIPWPFIKDLSSIGIVEVTKPVWQGFTALVPAGPTLEGVVSLPYTQEGDSTVVEVHSSIEHKVYICDRAL